MRRIEISVEDWVKIIELGHAVAVTIVLHGNSMEPLIRSEKDYITIVPRNGQKLQVGDVVLFRRTADDYVVHRIYKIQEKMIQTWGDNCRFPDAPVTNEDVIGIVDSVRKNGKKIQLTADDQRKKGIQWMNSPIRRRIWRFYWKICNKQKKLLKRMELR